MTPPVIFAGPSLTPDDRRGAKGLIFLPPAEQGDILRALARKPAAIGLIDGYFGDRPAVHQKEILEALAAGVPVAGAASMGALRAAELRRWGMVGVGRIFADFAAGRLTSDAEVAVSHGPELTGFAQTSIALVDVRATLGALARTRQFTAELRKAVLAAAEALHFTDRTWRTIAMAASASVPGGMDLETELRRSQVLQKRRDAVELVNLILEGGLPAPPRIPPPPMTRAYQVIRSRALEK